MTMGLRARSLLALALALGAFHARVGAFSPPRGHAIAGHTIARVGHGGQATGRGSVRRRTVRAAVIEYGESSSDDAAPPPPPPPPPGPPPAADDGGAALAAALGQEVLAKLGGINDPELGGQGGVG